MVIEKGVARCHGAFAEVYMDRALNYFGVCLINLHIFGKITVLVGEFAVNSSLHAPLKMLKVRFPYFAR